jgi:hypothetical protein
VQLSKKILSSDETQTMKNRTEEYVVISYRESYEGAADL